MRSRLERLAECARDVASQADRANETGDLTPLHNAMLAYRSAAVGYLSHPSVGDYIRADSMRYTGETKEALMRIAKLVDSLNET